MSHNNKSIYLLDMSQCAPQTAISRELSPAAWTAVDYEIAVGRGVMLFCPPDSEAPPLRLPLEVRGPHHIFVATYKNPLAPDCCLLLKLDSDAGYTRAVPETFRADKDLVDREMMAGPNDLTEAYWKTAHLDDNTLIFDRSRRGGMAEAIANIAYIRLVPVSEAEQAERAKLASRDDTRRLIANYDGGQHHQWAYASKEDMDDEFQAIADSDFKAVMWGVARSFATMYPSRVGSEIPWSPQLPGFSRAGHDAVENYRRNGIDPLKLAVACAHENGLDIYPQVRMSGEKYPPFHRHIGGPGDFQENHHEYRCLTPEGEMTRHLSQAFPEVRAQYVALFREWVEEYEADGVCIIFCRSWPYVLYETPVLESFQKQYSLDMRSLDFFDARVLAHRASFLTQLLRETRQMLDEVGETQGRRLQTSYVIPAEGYTPTGCPDLGPFSTPKSRAMDVETWINEGLVDHLIAHIERVGDPEGREGAKILKPYVDLARGTQTQVYADLYPRRQSADSMRRRAMACYEAGVDGLSFWDCQGRAMRLSGWAMHRLLGHRDELKDMKPFADSLFRTVLLQRLDGFDVEDEFCIPTDG